MRHKGIAALIGLCGLLAGCDAERNTRPIILRAKPPLIEHQFCMAMRDAERAPQDSVVMKGTAVHGDPDLFRVNCEGELHELLFALAPARNDDSPMKDLRKQWNKRTGAKDPVCARCPKYDVSANFVGMVKKDESGKLVFIVQAVDEMRRKRIRRGTPTDMKNETGRGRPDPK